MFANSSIQWTVRLGFLSCTKSWAVPVGKNIIRKVTVQELWLEEGMRVTCAQGARPRHEIASDFNLLAYFSALTCQELKKLARALPWT